MIRIEFDLFMYLSFKVLKLNFKCVIFPPAFQKILTDIENIDDSVLEASFECAIALVDREQNLELVVQGQMPGRVIKQVRGANGFGYDPMFIPQGFSKTAAELSDQDKDKISHRGIALRKMSGILKQLQG